MKKILYWVRILIYMFAGIVVLGIAESFLPMFMAMRLRGGNGALGTDKICADLLKGDYAAASEPIVLKTAKRELRFAETITWLGRQGESPYVEIPGSKLFADLPRDQGPLKSCDQPASWNLAGNMLSGSLYLGYAKSRVIVTLRYHAGLFSQKLQRIEIGLPELLTPSTPPPGEDERRMAEFMKKLDETTKKD